MYITRASILLVLLPASAAAACTGPAAPFQPVWALGGGNPDISGLDTCVTDPAATTAAGLTIAAQCCNPSDTSVDDGCRRRINGADTDAGCVGGIPPRPYTFAQAEALCTELGLSMCDRNCEGTGCQYNQNTV